MSPGSKLVPNEASLLASQATASLRGRAFLFLGHVERHVYDPILLARDSFSFPQLHQHVTDVHFVSNDNLTRVAATGPGGASRPSILTYKIPLFAGKT